VTELAAKLHDHVIEQTTLNIDLRSRTSSTRPTSCSQPPSVKGTRRQKSCSWTTCRGRSTALEPPT
jgi:hypothetical protein